MTSRPTMIVTGASRGIGAGIARRAAAEGYGVCVNYAASADRATALVEEIKAAGGAAVAIQADVRQPGDAERLFRSVAAELGPPRVLVNNAGISTLSPIADMEIETVRKIVETNLLGTIWCMREAIGMMSTARGGQGGVILNISSIAGAYGGMPGDAIYAGTKGGIDTLTLAVAKEVAREGIRVCGLRPGIIRTEIWEGEVSPEQIEELGRTAVPLGRIGEVDDVADAALWLCSQKASYVTGAILNVSGAREIFVKS